MNINKDRAIGVFDSGIGGLTVVRALMERLPFENIIYFGDTARVPYGIKSVETINRYAVQISDFLIKKDVKLLIVACNTMAAVAHQTMLICHRSRLGVMMSQCPHGRTKQPSKKTIGIIGLRRQPLTSNATPGYSTFWIRKQSVFADVSPLRAHG